MSKRESKNRDPQSVKRATKRASATRIDAPHLPPKQDARPAPAPKSPAKELQYAAVGKSVGKSGEKSEPALATGGPAVTEQLRNQAAQLSAHLRARQKELDHRESMINARLAQLDASARSSRLWFGERQNKLEEDRSKLAEWRSKLDQRQRAVDTRLERLAVAEAATNRDRKSSEEGATGREQELKRREAELAAAVERLDTQAAARKEAQQSLEARRLQVEKRLEHEKQKIDSRREASLELVRQMLAGLERRREAVEAHAEKARSSACRPGPQLLAREQEALRTAEALDSREREIEQAESLLAKAHGESEQLREQLTLSRRKIDEEARRQRQRMAVEQRRSEAELDKKRQSLQRRSEHVDQSRAALQEFRDELGKMHRETLEIRLATEELWAQLSGAAPPAALTRSLGRIRAQLTEHYRMAGAELDEHKDELQTLRSELAEQHEKLVRQKQELEQWSGRRQEEIEQQAARLVAREQELDRQQAQFEESAHQWRAEQLGYQQEIRRLRRHPQEAEPAAA